MTLSDSDNALLCFSVESACVEEDVCQQVCERIDDIDTCRCVYPLDENCQGQSSISSSSSSSDDVNVNVSVNDDDYNEDDDYSNNNNSNIKNSNSFTRCSKFQHVVPDYCKSSLQITSENCKVYKFNLMKCMNSLKSLLE